MSEFNEDVAGRLAPLVRMLSSNIDAEALSAVRSIARVLKTAGLDIHDLAARIEQPSGLTQNEMELIYSRGYDAGVKAAEDKFHGDGDFRNVDGPSWNEMARWRQRHSERLGMREREFVNSVTARTVWRDPTPKQEKWLKSIFFKLGGRI